MPCLSLKNADIIVLHMVFQRVHIPTTRTQCTFWGQGKTHKLLICLQYKAASVSDNLDDDVALRTLQSEKEGCRLGLRGGTFTQESGEGKQHGTSHFLNQNKKVLCLNYTKRNADLVCHDTWRASFAQQQETQKASDTKWPPVHWIL